MSRVPVANETVNRLTAQAIGNKADTLSEVEASTVSVFAYLKGVIRGAPKTSQTGLGANHPTGTTTLFTVTGSIIIHDIVGTVQTTAMAAAATATKLSARCDALVSTDICATVDLTGAAVGTSYHITGTVANAAVLGTNGVTIAQAGELIVVPVTSAIITMNNAGAANAGRMRWFLRWSPLSPGATVTAAF